MKKDYRVKYNLNKEKEVKDITMKSDLKDIAAYLLYSDIPFEIIREKYFIRLLTDIKEILFKYSGDIIEINTRKKPEAIKEFRLPS